MANFKDYIFYYKKINRKGLDDHFRTDRYYKDCYYRYVLFPLKKPHILYK